MSTKEVTIKGDIEKKSENIEVITLKKEEYEELTRRLEIFEKKKEMSKKYIEKYVNNPENQDKLREKRREYFRKSYEKLKNDEEYMSREPRFSAPLLVGNQGSPHPSFCLEDKFMGIVYKQGT